jgi:hypothetical protein
VEQPTALSSAANIEEEQVASSDRRRARQPSYTKTQPDLRYLLRKATTIKILVKTMSRIAIVISRSAYVASRQHEQAIFDVERNVQQPPAPYCRGAQKTCWTSC